MTRPASSSSSERISILTTHIGGHCVLIFRRISNIPETPSRSERQTRTILPNVIRHCLGLSRAGRCPAYNPQTGQAVRINYQELPERSLGCDLTDDEIIFLRSVGISPDKIPHWVAFRGEREGSEDIVESLLVYYPQS